MQSTQTKWINSFTNGKTHRQQSTVGLFLMMYHNESTSEPLISTTTKKTFQQPTKAHWNCWHGRQSAKTTLWVESVTKPENRAYFTHWMMWGMDVFAETQSCSALILNVCDKKEVGERYETLPVGEMHISLKYLFSNSKQKLHSGGCITLPATLSVKP